MIARKTWRAQSPTRVPITPADSKITAGDRRANHGELVPEASAHAYQGPDNAPPRSKQESCAKNASHRKRNMKNTAPPPRTMPTLRALRDVLIMSNVPQSPAPASASSACTCRCGLGGYASSSFAREPVSNRYTRSVATRWFLDNLVARPH